MNAVYPGAVRTYSQKQDQVTTIDASDVNTLQDEMGAVQRTLGINPLSFLSPGEPTVTYPSVAKRLDSHETDLASLQNQINILSFAASNGWSTPVLSINQSGVTPGVLTVPNPTNFTTVTWNNPPTQDPGDMWTGGSALNCVLGGWYTINVTFQGPIDVIALNNAQNTLNASGLIPIPLAFQRVLAQLLVNGTVVSTQTSVHPWAPNYVFAHYCNFTWHGALHQGDQFKVQLGQYNGGLSGIASLSATYVRALPGVT